LKGAGLALSDILKMDDHEKQIQEFINKAVAFSKDA